MKGNTPIKMIPLEKIHILNPRARNQRIFRDIVENITRVGLKRPITVTAGSSSTGKEYDLVCGQGRIEAYLASGQSHIPAIVIDASEEQALIMSLVENCARRHRRVSDLLQGIEILQNQGYDDKAIAAKTGLGLDYTRGMLRLLNNGEERLLSAVEAGKIPITVAVKIVDTPDDAIQQALQEAYDSHQLRGKKFMEAKRLVETRRRRGASIKYGGKSQKGTQAKLSGEDVVRVYQKEVDRKRLLTRKAEFANNRMIFMVEALRRLFTEKGFKAILQTEGLATLPKPLSELIDVVT
jgi:ParB family chromosome partitioning protein